MPKALPSLTGQIIGRWTVCEEQPRLVRDRVYRCVCECGREHNVRQSHLVGRKSTSCGCARGRPVHGASRNPATGKKETPEYTSWRAMRDRCENPNNIGFADYGGRGIAVCGRWAESFANFLSDMGSKPSLQHSIERIDGGGNYEPGNCRWATASEQARNKSISIMVTYADQTKNLADWADEMGVPYHTVYSRLQRGWPVERVLREWL